MMPSPWLHPGVANLVYADGRGVVKKRELDLAGVRMDASTILWIVFRAAESVTSTTGSGCRVALQEVSDHAL